MTRVAIVSASGSGEVSGNNTTLRRIARGLRARGLHVVEVFLGNPEGGTARLPEGLGHLDLLHALHARKAGGTVQAAARARGIPYVATLTGTDVHQDLASPRHAAAVRSVLLGAAALLASSERLADLVIERLGLPVPVAVVPTAVEDPAGWRRPAPEADGRVLFLQVGGWREVKNNLFPLGPLATLAAQLPGLRLRYLGPVREEAYHARWRDVAPDVPFAEDGGVVDPGGMPAAYAEAAALLNTSHSEGASNAMLEAMAAARAVLASDVPGNAELLSFDPDRWEESTGVLYRVTAGPDGRPVHDPADFLAKARRLALDPALRRRIGENAHRAVLAAHTPDLELDGVLSSYRLALS